MPGEFDVHSDSLPSGTFVVRVSGDLDLATAPRLEDACAAREARSRLVIDLEACTFMDSSGIRVLTTQASTLAGEGGRLELVVVDPGIARVLEITGLTPLATLHSSLDAVS